MRQDEADRPDIWSVGLRKCERSGKTGAAFHTDDSSVTGNSDKLAGERCVWSEPTIRGALEIAHNPMWMRSMALVMPRIPMTIMSRSL